MEIIQNNRIDYIDIIKGFTILWVVAIHTSSPQTLFDWLAVPYRMPLFFFMSGIFFKLRPIKEFAVKRLNTLILPFLIWFVISWVFMLIKFELIGNHLSISVDTPNSTWGAIFHIFGLFNISNPEYHTPIAAVQNAPLWFLLALFNVQMIFYFIKKFISNNLWIILTAVILFIIGHLLLNIGVNGPIILPTSLSYLIYFAMGSLYGKTLMEYIKNFKNEIKLGLTALIIFVGLLCVDVMNFHLMIQQCIIFIQALCLIVIVIIFFRHTYQWFIFKPLRFFGQNTLPLLCTHLFIKFTIYTVFVKMLNLSQFESNLTLAIIFHIFTMVVICISEYFIIKFCNRYTPYTVGKQDIIKLHTNR